MLQKELFNLPGSDGNTLFADLTYDDKATINSTIILVHGFKGFKDWGAHNLVAAFFASNGYRYLKFNLAYSGVTGDKPNDVSDMEAFAANTFSKELYDIDVVVDYAQSRFPGCPVILIGHSRGGGLSIIKAANDPRITKLVTWSSIAEFSSLWKKEQEAEWIETGKIYVENARTKEKMPLNNTLLEDFRKNEATLNILDAAERISIPWLILHGDDDVNVNFRVAQQLAQRQLNAKIQKIEGANHVFGASHPYNATGLPAHLQEVAQKTLSFISQ